MYLPQDDISEVVLRQRNKKDKLAEELCKNKAKVARLLKDLRILSQPFNTDIAVEMKDLDDEIEKLRRCCQDMSNSLIENSGNRESAIITEQRQPLRPAPPPPPQAPPRARPYNLFAGLPVPSPRSPHSPQSPASQHSQTPSPVCQAPSPDPQPQTQLQPKTIDDNDGTDPNCGEQPWACSMCTFRNHPLLNKCEFCDNIRILSGTVRIVPSNPSVRPLLGLCSKSEPPTPATPASGPTSARLFTSLSAEHNRPGVPTSTSEGNLIQFTGDVLM